MEILCPRHPLLHQQAGRNRLLKKINKYMKTEEEINEMIRIFALANLIEKGIKKVEEKYQLNDDGTITEREKGPEKT